MTERYDVVVIGAGPGGFRAARRCAQRGASTALVEKEFPGGTCLNWGCIPSKTLLASAHLLHRARHAGDMGIDIPSATPNWAKIQQRREAIITGTRKGMVGTLKNHGVTYIEGRAVVTAPGRVNVQSNGQNRDLEAGKIILAMGSDTIQIPTIPFDGQVVISSKEALSLAEIPQSMVIVGGGVIGCEMACAYAVFGTKITIVEALDRLLPMEDTWVSRLVEREFKGLGIEVMTARKVMGVEKSVSPAKVSLDGGQTIEAQKVLIAVGRRARVDKDVVGALGLEMNGPAIKVNKKLETSVPGVYALGDIVGTTYLAHGATAEAEIAAANATGGNEEMLDYSLVPRVVFTFPEVASVGKSEEKCQAAGMDITVGKGFYRANGRCHAENLTNGQFHAIRDNAMNEIVGISMVGDMATEFVAFARTLLGTCEPIRQITFPHPTISETMEDALHEALGELLFEQ
ncbi:MAG: dihydrolipoyl dehydrogenase [Phycisphaerae bacterium]|nr:dihydrolipoyl dehydrogenase [Phycisphaerae bacterium]HON92349.1 dihydrolipoyl dehydrogenase [Sedimentisphaerales bacterium]